MALPCYSLCDQAVVMAPAATAQLCQATRHKTINKDLFPLMISLQCSDTVDSATRMASGLYKAACLFVCVDDLTGTLNVL